MEKESQEENNEDYIGNIWGWRISYYSLAFIIAILLIMLMRYIYLLNTGDYHGSPVIDTLE